MASKINTVKGNPNPNYIKLPTVIGDDGQPRTMTRDELEAEVYRRDLERRREGATYIGEDGNTRLVQPVRAAADQLNDYGMPLNAGYSTQKGMSPVERSQAITNLQNLGGIGTVAVTGLDVGDGQVYQDKRMYQHNLNNLGKEVGVRPAWNRVTLYNDVNDPRVQMSDGSLPARKDHRTLGSLIRGVNTVERNGNIPEGLASYLGDEMFYQNPNLMPPDGNLDKVFVGMGRYAAQPDKPDAPKTQYYIEPVETLGTWHNTNAETGATIPNGFLSSIAADKEGRQKVRGQFNNLWTQLADTSVPDSNKIITITTEKWEGGRPIKNPDGSPVYEYKDVPLADLDRIQVDPTATVGNTMNWINQADNTKPIPRYNDGMVANVYDETPFGNDPLTQWSEPGSTLPISMIVDPVSGRTRNIKAGDTYIGDNGKPQQYTNEDVAHLNKAQSTGSWVNTWAGIDTGSNPDYRDETYYLNSTPQPIRDKRTGQELVLSRPYNHPPEGIAPKRASVIPVDNIELQSKLNQINNRVVPLKGDYGYGLTQLTPNVQMKSSWADDDIFKKHNLTYESDNGLIQYDWKGQPIQTMADVNNLDDVDFYRNMINAPNSSAYDIKSSIIQDPVRQQERLPKLNAALEQHANNQWAERLENRLDATPNPKFIANDLEAVKPTDYNPSEFPNIKVRKYDANGNPIIMDVQTAINKGGYAMLPNSQLHSTIDRPDFKEVDNQSLTVPEQVLGDMVYEHEGTHYPIYSTDQFDGKVYAKNTGINNTEIDVRTLYDVYHQKEKELGILGSVNDPNYDSTLHQTVSAKRQELANVLNKYNTLQGLGEGEANWNGTVWSDSYDRHAVEPDINVNFSSLEEAKAAQRNKGLNLNPYTVIGDTPEERKRARLDLQVANEVLGNNELPVEAQVYAQKMAVLDAERKADSMALQAALKPEYRSTPITQSSQTPSLTDVLNRRYDALQTELKNAQSGGGVVQGAAPLSSATALKMTNPETGESMVLRGQVPVYSASKEGLSTEPMSQSIAKTIQEINQQGLPMVKANYGSDYQSEVKRDPTFFTRPEPSPTTKTVTNPVTDAVVDDSIANPSRVVETVGSAGENLVEKLAQAANAVKPKWFNSRYVHGTALGAGALTIGGLMAALNGQRQEPQQQGYYNRPPY